MNQLKLEEAKRLIDLANKSKREHEDFYQISNLVFSMIMVKGIEFVDGQLPYKLVYIRELMYEYPYINHGLTNCWYDLLSISLTSKDGNLVIPVPLLSKDFLCSMIQFYEVQERLDPEFYDEVIEPTMTKLAFVEEFLSICDELQIDKDELELFTWHVFEPKESKDLLKWLSKKKKKIKKRKSVTESAFEELCQYYETNLNK